MPFFFEHKGVRFAYDAFGSPELPVVVFSHGFLMDGDMFRQNIAALENEFHCIVWDQRGFGRTGPVAEAFTYWDSAKDLIALLDHLEIASASLVGMSQGGFVSMRAALLEQDRFRALALISTRSDVDPSSVRQSFEGLKVEWAQHGASHVAQPLSEFLFGPGYDASSWIQKWMNLGIDHFDHPVDALILRDDITLKLAEITHPSIVFHGRADSAISAVCGEELAANLPNCKDFVVVDHAGHTPNLTHAHSVNAPLRDFLLRYAR